MADQVIPTKTTWVMGDLSTERWVNKLTSYDGLCVRVQRRKLHDELDGGRLWMGGGGDESRGRLQKRKDHSESAFCSVIYRGESNPIRLKNPQKYAEFRSMCSRSNIHR